jgi:PAS domain S-box-containing protein
MSIRLKLTIIILALVTIPLLFVSVISFSNYEHSLEAARLSQFENLADFKADRVEAYFAGLRTQIEMAQSYYIIRKHLPLLIRSGNGRSDPLVTAARKVLDKQLRGIQKTAGLSDIMLTDNNGRIVYASDPGYYATTRFKSLPEIHLASFKEGLNRIFFSEIFLSEPAGNRPAMLITAPAFDLNDAVIGVIVFEMDMAPLYEIIQDTTSLGKTGEILIGKKFSTNEIRYLNPLRHDPGAAFKKSVTPGTKIALPIQMAVRGETGIGRSIDYRGKEVVAAWRYIPSLKWGLVAKMDSAEAFEVVANLRRLLIMVLAIVFAMVFIITFSVARSISRPIDMLTLGAEIIGGGDLDYRVGTTLKDEIGRLSRSFDKMTHDLKETTASRDELNREIEERKRTEEALRESESGLKRAQEISHLGNWELDLTDNRLTWSDEVYRIFGLEPQAFGATYEAFLEAVHPDDRATVNEAYSGSLLNGKDAYEIEHRVVRKGSGEIRFVHEKCEHFRDAEGKIVRSVGMVQDITERKKAEEALRESEERFRVIAEASPIQISVGHEEDGAILFTNPEYDRAFGFAKGELIGHKTPELYADPADRAKVISMLRERGSLTNYEVQVKKSDGSLFWVALSINRIRYAGGDALLASSVDITVRKKAEEALRLRTEELKASNEELTFFNRAMVDREERMIELKKQVNELEGRLGLPPRYDIDFGEKRQ